MNLLTSNIKVAKDAKEYLTAERCYITEVANDSADANLSVAIARVEPGVTTAWHYLKATNERYLIISGAGLVELGPNLDSNLSSDAHSIGVVFDGEVVFSSNVTVGDVVRIPPGVAQRITNTGPVDLLFYAVCTPRFVEESYISLE